MLRRFPLAVKFGLAFTIVILLSVSLVYFFTARSITQRFDEYRRQNRELFGKTLSSQLAWYRGSQGTWVGVDRAPLPDRPRGDQRPGIRGAFIDIQRGVLPRQ